MKKITIIVFENGKEYDLLSNKICEKFTADENIEFCGLWGEIQYNANEVINSISATVNHFIKSSKKEIVFGCCEKDYIDIVKEIDLYGCFVNKIDGSSIFK